MVMHEFDAREVEQLSRKVTGGDWEVSYGEIWTGGDLTIFSTIDHEDGSQDHRFITTLSTHGEDRPFEIQLEDAANAELLVRAPRMFKLIQLLASAPSDINQEAFMDLQTDAVALLNELAREWSR